MFEDLKMSELSWLENFNFLDKGYDSSSTDDLHAYLTTQKNKTVDSVSYTNPIIVPLISNKDRLYYNSSTEFYGALEDGNLYYDASNYPLNSKKNGLNAKHIKPAIRVDNIIKAIEKEINLDVTTPSIEFSNDFFKYLSKIKPDKSNEIQLTDAIELYIEDNKKVIAFPLEGKIFDCGDNLQLILANIEFAMKNPEMKSRIKNYLQKK